jgi:hypothetical protein
MRSRRVRRRILPVMRRRRRRRARKRTRAAVAR